MKLFTSILFTFSTAQDSVSLRPEPRVYWQLSKMMTTFNPDFSSKKYWLYGCNCVMLGNNQSSSSKEKINFRQIESSKVYAKIHAKMTLLLYYLYEIFNKKYLNLNQLSDPGYGPPVDALDTACKRHKDCLRFFFNISYC